MITRSPLVNLMLRACDKATKGLIRDFNELEHLQVSQKGPSDFVSAADIRVQRIIREELQKTRPDFGFLGEEGDDITSESGARWIVDPIDGTTNFLHSLPHFCISIAAEENGVLTAGVVYDPIKQEIFWAASGFGAFCNERRIKVSGRKNLNESLLAVGFPFKGHGDHDRFLEKMRRVMPEVAGVRRMGAAALDLAYVAAGRFEAYYEENVKPWDIAAGLVLVREAGGILTDSHGGNDMLINGSVLAANPALHGAFANILRD